MATGFFCLFVVVVVFFVSTTKCPDHWRCLIWMQFTKGDKIPGRRRAQLKISAQLQPRKVTMIRVTQWPSRKVQISKSRVVASQGRYHGYKQPQPPVTKPLTVYVRRLLPLCCSRHCGFPLTSGPMFMSRQKHPDKTQHPQKAEWRRRLLTVTNSCSEGSPERRQRRQGGGYGHLGRRAFWQRGIWTAWT